MADESSKSSGSDGRKDHDVQRMAAAIEDLLYMEVIKFKDVGTTRERRSYFVPPICTGSIQRYVKHESKIGKK